jgi:hypothetical protein
MQEIDSPIGGGGALLRSTSRRRRRRVSSELIQRCRFFAASICGCRFSSTLRRGEHAVPRFPCRQKAPSQDQWSVLRSSMCPRYFFRTPKPIRGHHKNRHNSFVSRSRSAPSRTFHEELQHRPASGRSCSHRFIHLNPVRFTKRQFFRNFRK